MLRKCVNRSNLKKRTVTRVLAVSLFTCVRWQRCCSSLCFIYFYGQAIRPLPWKSSNMWFCNTEYGRYLFNYSHKRRCFEYEEEICKKVTCCFWQVLGRVTQFMFFIVILLSILAVLGTLRKCGVWKKIWVLELSPINFFRMGGENVQGYNDCWISNYNPKLSLMKWWPYLRLIL